MSELIYGREEELLPWAQDRIGVKFRKDAYTIGLSKGGKLAAVVVYDSFSDIDCNMHISSDGTRAWLNKSLLLAAFAYPFTQMGYQRVTGLVPADNEAALKFDENLGFVREGYHPKAAHNGGDIISLGLLKENCRFIPRGDYK
ncbi:hypothetical protein UFOVP275_16 [uncultured Caudovirales phage]|uniref:Uncharacterized protein n=1 Tax=uncultured Caudovirales phage TaxID=2100421 RepID=A0A6J5LJQ1_9CAUD|nr:hypothetical protein UFOVP275_16 [uncultured Caudovirales phage]